MKRRCATASTPWTATSDRKSTRLNSSHDQISYAVFCLKKKKSLVDLLLVRRFEDVARRRKDRRLAPVARLIIAYLTPRLGAVVPRSALVAPRRVADRRH